MQRAAHQAVVATSPPAVCRGILQQLGNRIGIWRARASASDRRSASLGGVQGREEDEDDISDGVALVVINPVRRVVPLRLALLRLDRGAAARTAAVAAEATVIALLAWMCIGGGGSGETGEGGGGACCICESMGSDAGHGAVVSGCK